MSLLKFIPSEYHNFYTQLKYEGADEDFGMASGDSDEK